MCSKPTPSDMGGLLGLVAQSLSVDVPPQGACFRLCEELLLLPISLHVHGTRVGCIQPFLHIHACMQDLHHRENQSTYKVGATASCGLEAAHGHGMALTSAAVRVFNM